MKRLATIEKILNVYPHTNADKLECVTVLGYQCIVPKGKYKIGDKIIYIQPDTILPDSEWAESFKKYAPKRIKAVKLRNEWSEGLVVDLIDVNIEGNLKDDVTDILGILKWIPPIPNDINAIGPIPLNISKTDEERWENLIDILPFGEKCDLTLKIDGQSCSYYFHETFGVLGRAQELKTDSVNKYTYHVSNMNIDEKLENFCKKHNISLCIRGESHGKGIQSTNINPHSKYPNSWKMFSVWNIEKRRYEKKGDKYYFLNIAEELKLPTVDIIEKDVILTKELIQKYSKELKKLNGISFEGIVVQHSKGSFKIMNKHYDSKK